MVSLTVRVDEELHRRLRHLAVERRESVQTIAERLLREFVEREERRPPKRREVKR